MKTKRIVCALLCLVMLMGLPFAAGADPILGVEDNIFPPEVEIIEVNNKSDFNAMREDTTGYYRLVADLKFTETDFSSDGDFAGGFVPLPTFSGVLDGNGHTIVGLQIKGAEDGRTGLFAENKGTVCDLRLVDVNVVQDDAAADTVNRVGVLSGSNFGKIIGCAVYGTVEAKIDNSRIAIGSLTGHNSGTIENCAAVTTITVKRNVDALVYQGGIAGTNEYWTTGAKNYKAMISCCYANVEMEVNNAGTYTAGTYNANIVGLNQNAVVERCYYPAGGDAAAKEDYVNTSVDGYVGDCTGIAADKLDQASSYPALNMEEYWRVGKEPVLKAFACMDLDGNKVCDVCGDVIAIPAPVITTQPTHKTVTVGNTATYTVAATGENLSYQWYSCGDNLTALSDNANYSGTKTATLTVKTAGTTWCNGGAPMLLCTVSNEGGNVDSVAVYLTVNHKSGAWKTVKEPTEKATGLKERYCTACNTRTGSQTIAKLPAKGPTATVNFTDVKKSDFFYTPVQWAVANGVTTGTSSTTFGPNESCTRAQAVTFLWRAAGSPAPKSSKNPFTDVKKSDYYYKAVLWAAEKGVTSGTTATTFSPNDTCTRGQIVTFLWRAQSGKKVSAANPFKDVKKSDFYYDAVLWAGKNGVTTGTSKTTFGPAENCTRGQIVTFLYRAMQK